MGNAQFTQQAGALLLGRRTFDVALGFGGEGPHGDRPVLVATHRSIRANIPSVHAVTGTIVELVASAKQRAGNKDMYLDGLRASKVRRSLEFTGCYPFGEGMIQTTARPRLHP